MAESNEISKLSQEELETKRKSLANWQKIFVGIAAVSVVMTLYAVYKDNIDKHAFFILAALLLVMNNGNKLKKVDEEIAKRKNFKN